LDFSQEHFGKFENHTRFIGSKLLRHMGYVGQGLGKRRKDILIPIVATPWAKHEVLGIIVRTKNPRNMRPFL
jgi:hypothetical protein